MDQSNFKRSMSLHHRAIESRESGINKILYQIRYPLNIVIPLIISGLGLLSVRELFGQTWQTGTLSLVLVPFVGNLLLNLLAPQDNIILSTIIIIGYAACSLTLYTYVYYLTKRHLPAILSGILLLLPFMPFSSEFPSRLILALTDFDGAHVLGTALLPLAILFFQKHLRSGEARERKIFAIIATILGLISFFTYLILNIYLIFILISEVLVDNAKIKMLRYLRSMFIMSVIFLVIYNIAIYRMITSEPGRLAFMIITNFIPMSFFLVPILGTFAFLIFDRQANLQPLFIALSTAIFFGILHLIGSSFLESALTRQERFAVEFSTGLSFLLGIIITAIFDGLRQGKMIKRFMAIYRIRSRVAILFIGLVSLSLLFSLLLIPRSI